MLTIFGVAAVVRPMPDHSWQSLNSTIARHGHAAHVPTFASQAGCHPAMLDRCPEDPPAVAGSQERTACCGRRKREIGKFSVFENLIWRVSSPLVDYSFSNSAGVIPACRRILLNVPMGTSDFFGTMAVRRPCSVWRANLTWLPFWLTSDNPAASSFRLTSRKVSGLSSANFGLDQADWRSDGGAGRFEVEFHGFAEIAESFFLGSALAGDVHFQALGHVPVALAPDGCRE